MSGLSIKVLLFLLPVLVIILLMEIALRRMPNDYKEKGAYLEEHAEEIEVLVFGSSHSYYGINPEYFSSHTYNAAFYSQTLRFDLEILKKYQSRLEQVNTIILPISYFSFQSQLETGNAPYLVKKYNLYMGMDVSSALKDHMELLGVQARKNFKKLGDYYIRGEDPITCNKLGWGTTHHSSDKRDLEETGEVASLRHTRRIEAAEAERVEENLGYLSEFINICKEKNIRLILLTLPAYETYTNGLKKEYLEYNRLSIHRMIESSKNCIYMDLLYDPDFSTEDYYDADHLNEIGARKLSLKLDLYLEKDH